MPLVQKKSALSNDRIHCCWGPVWPEDVMMPSCFVLLSSGYSWIPQGYLFAPFITFGSVWPQGPAVILPSSFVPLSSAHSRIPQNYLFTASNFAYHRVACPSQFYEVDH
ncbi:unnamed protein product [Pieris macdunnoughi]|uniref:Uncharacterized protein n=1 Tax=Pieris macdunnoughi TaxID=345717 RepID=A0A821U1P7_9NEOP|nr:unnamed protein product [Pieris macdunnoughi]